MSLSSIIEKNPEIRKEFPNLKSHLTDYSGKLLKKEDWKTPIKVASIGTSLEAGYIGTAFDYVARSVLTKKYGVPERQLVAVGGLERFPRYIEVPLYPTGDTSIDNERSKGQRLAAKNVKKIMNYLSERLDFCIDNRQKFLTGACDLDQIIEDAVFLTSLEYTFRARSIHVADYYFKETEGKTYFSQKRMITE